jgi:hypothetical protein
VDTLRLCWHFLCLVYTGLRWYISIKGREFLEDPTKQEEVGDDDSDG